jgi:hypothetical protein
MARMKSRRLQILVLKKFLLFSCLAILSVDSIGQPKNTLQLDSQTKARSAAPTENQAESLAHSLQEINTKLDKFIKGGQVPWFIGILSALAGGLLVLAGQGLDRIYKSKAEKRTAIQEIKTQVIYLVNLLPRLLYSLAYYKVDARLQNYWVDNCPASNAPDKAKFFEEMHRDYATINDFELRINDTIAQIASQLAKFDLINKSSLYTVEAREFGNINFDEKPFAIEKDMDGEPAAIEVNIAALYSKFRIKYGPINKCIEKFPVEA